MITNTLQGLHSLFSMFAAGCQEHLLFFLPTWYKYLVLAGKMEDVNGRCATVVDLEVADLALILLAVLDIVLRLAGLVAVAYVMFGGFKFITSQGDAEGIKKARQTITNALIGLVIALLATAFVGFIGTRLG